MRCFNIVVGREILTAPHPRHYCPTTQGVYNVSPPRMVLFPNARIVGPYGDATGFLLHGFAYVSLTP
jgi:hypothetical protein